MCTLILGVDVLGPRTVLLAANRDEDPARPSDPPQVLSERPRVVGGRDRQAGGTWLALRGPHAAVAMLNRRSRRRSAPSPLAADARQEEASMIATAPARRSRGLLALEAAAAEPTGGSIPHAILARAEVLTGVAPYAPFSLVVASPDGCWLLALDGTGPARSTPIGPGWHVLTHEDLDDPREPRAAWLGRALAAFAPGSRAEAEVGLTALLRLHARESRPGSPAVCIHAGRMRTVSSALVWLAAGEAAYAHAEGRPCTQPFEDLAHLLTDHAGAA